MEIGNYEMLFAHFQVSLRIPLRFLEKIKFLSWRENFTWLEIFFFFFGFFICEGIVFLVSGKNRLVIFV